ncbi:MAG: alpha/beta hydrolase [Kaiparowitsia implicata GSE-PSE-MK54-09C]|jgi:pimeloyl-ACP methyl ester carboxylesterase|nr:alpha/beta hydrolase [Kaiparowitsia implicata GSE-PSE-MK54-09C]
MSTESIRPTQSDPHLNPDFLLFAQHGWHDTNKAMTALARQLVGANIPVVAPRLGLVQTWLRIEPLIQKLEAIAHQAIAHYPHTPLRIVGHSMGGLMWLELLHRHPEWQAQVHSLVLVGSPVGGADLGRLIDPFSFGIGIAADLGKNRRAMAEAIAQSIPILVIAGDVDDGSDGTVPLTCTQVAHAQFVKLTGIRHASLKAHPRVAATILDFWQDFQTGESILVNDLIQHLRAIPGMTDGHPRGIKRSRVVAQFPNGSSLRTWRNSVGINHVFLESATGQCLYAGFVGWPHADDLRRELEALCQTVQPTEQPF